MYDPATTESLLFEIDDNTVYLTPSERVFHEECVRKFEDEGALDTDSLLGLYELLDRLDGRTGRSSEEEYDFDTADVW